MRPACGRVGVGASYEFAPADGSDAGCAPLEAIHRGNLQRMARLLVDPGPVEVVGVYDAVRCVARDRRASSLPRSSKASRGRSNATSPPPSTRRASCCAGCAAASPTGTAGVGREARGSARCPRDSAPGSPLIVECCGADGQSQLSEDRRIFVFRPPRVMWRARPGRSRADSWFAPENGRFAHIDRWNRD